MTVMELASILSQLPDECYAFGVFLSNGAGIAPVVAVSCPNPGDGTDGDQFRCILHGDNGPVLLIEELRSLPAYKAATCPLYN